MSLASRWSITPEKRPSIGRLRSAGPSPAPTTAGPVPLRRRPIRNLTLGRRIAASSSLSALDKRGLLVPATPPTSFSLVSVSCPPWHPGREYTPRYSPGEGARRMFRPRRGRPRQSQHTKRTQQAQRNQQKSQKTDPPFATSSPKKAAPRGTFPKDRLTFVGQAVSPAERGTLRRPHSVRRAVPLIRQNLSPAEPTICDPRPLTPPPLRRYSQRGGTFPSRRNNNPRSRPPAPAPPTRRPVARKPLTREIKNCTKNLVPKTDSRAFAGRRPPTVARNPTAPKIENCERNLIPKTDTPSSRTLADKKSRPPGLPPRAGSPSWGRRFRLPLTAPYAVRIVSALSPLIAACAAASRAIGTRYGEHDT
jgi:hypothetical protein